MTGHLLILTGLPPVLIWGHSQCWHHGGEMNLLPPLGIKPIFLAHPVCGLSLYWLSYPGSVDSKTIKYDCMVIISNVYLDIWSWYLHSIHSIWISWWSAGSLMMSQHDLVMKLCTPITSGVGQNLLCKANWMHSQWTCVTSFSSEEDCGYSLCFFTSASNPKGNMFLLHVLKTVTCL